MGARNLVLLVAILCLGAGAPDPIEMEVGGVLPMRGGGAAVVLIDSTRSKALPIAVSGTEALSIQLRLAKQHYPRPLTHDLMESIVRELGGKIVRVQVDESLATDLVDLHAHDLASQLANDRLHQVMGERPGVVLFRQAELDGERQVLD